MPQREDKIPGTDPRHLGARITPMTDSEAAGVVGGTGSSACTGTGPAAAPHGYDPNGNPWPCKYAGCPAGQSPGAGE